MAERKSASKGAQHGPVLHRMDRRRTSGDAGARTGTEARRASARGHGGRTMRGAHEDRRDGGNGSHHGRAAPRDHQSHRARPLAETRYGMPACAKDGNIVCFFRSGEKFKTRYAMLGFTDKPNLDEDTIWPVACALKELTTADEARISALVQKAVS
jgi:hypothetical protein